MGDDPAVMSAVLLGTHIYPASGDAEIRMRRALDAWTALPVRLVNLQFANDSSPIEYPSFDTRAVLREDSRSITGLQGPRKPTMRALLDGLVDAAEQAGCTYAGFSNADIIVTPSAIERVVNGGRDAVIFSRMGIDPQTGAAAGEFLSGQDTLFIRPAVYRALRPRLRPYIVGEMPWDVIYTSVLLTHCRAELVNRGDDCRHVDHEAIWVDSPYAPHAWRLAKMDWTYFARWYRYYYPAKAMRERGAPAADEEALKQSVFGPLTPMERAKSLYRRIRWGAG
jgi:hypothetical protein